MRNIKLCIAYDGSRYRGWQRLPDCDRTIQGKLEQVISRILNEEIQLTGSGRTDAGVHAAGQVANFHCRSELPCEELRRALLRYLPEDIGILSVVEAGERFHSRLNASWKTYQYRIWNSDMPCIWERQYVYPFREPLNLCAMQEGASIFLGTHDFSALCSNRHYKKSTVRTIRRALVTREGCEVRFLVEGDGFLYNMVRIMTGTLLEIGAGRRDPGSISELFQNGSRAAAGYTVPARGLCLMEVIYS